MTDPAATAGLLRPLSCQPSCLPPGLSSKPTRCVSPARTRACLPPSTGCQDCCRRQRRRCRLPRATHFCRWATSAGPLGSLCRRWCRRAAARKRWRGRRCTQTYGEAREAGGQAWGGRETAQSKQQTGTSHQPRARRAPAAHLPPPAQQTRSPQVYGALVAEAGGAEVDAGGARQAQKAAGAGVHRKHRLQGVRVGGGGGDVLLSGVAARTVLSAQQFYAHLAGTPTGGVAGSHSR